MYSGNDRAGYGESDPNPKLLVKSEACDIQELADQVQLGPNSCNLELYQMCCVPHRQGTQGRP